MGVGEIVVNSINKDGVMKGYDMDLVAKVKEKISLPMTVLGGACSLDDIEKVVDKHGVIGVVV